MLFTKDKWNNAQAVKPYLQASAALSFDTCASSFQQAEDKYLVPIFGSIIHSISEMIEEELRDYNVLELFKDLQGAEANLALFENFDEFQVRLTDQGVQRQETEKFKQAYRYQEHNMQRHYLNRGLNYIEKAINFLDKEEGLFYPTWKDLEYHQARKSLIVCSPQEISNLHFINNSPIIYLRLLPSIRYITDTELPKVLGRKMYQDLMNSLKNGYEYLNSERCDMTLEELRIECGKFVIFKALAQLVRETGSITERGLYFGAVKASTPNPDEATPANQAQIRALAAQLDDSAYKYSSALHDIIETTFPKYFGGHESDIYTRDNRHKRMVWL